MMKRNLTTDYRKLPEIDQGKTTMLFVRYGNNSISHLHANEKEIARQVTETHKGLTIYMAWIPMHPNPEVCLKPEIKGILVPQPSPPWWKE